ncbi:protein scarlet-like [Planococcus citri]|uniref:protein scarlet-like n=1 Tax=Planococcus citri TaxID=170843 RepID=UPI0031F87A3D
MTVVKNVAMNEKSSLNIPSSDMHLDKNGVEFKEDQVKSMENKGVSVIWKNLRVTADIKTQHVFGNTTHTFKEIIHDVSGFVEPCSLVAILGASGSGKSTLMSVLANRQPGDLKVEGDVRINGDKIPLKLMRSISGFVYQDDVFIPTLTILEHLHFAAKLKLDKRITTECRKKLVDDLLKDVGLTKCANRLIGTSNYGEAKMNLSGGELKRLSVATELLTNPPLLFCDEPTTGLDSFTALKLIMIMKNMTSQRGKTIICSIHQPNEKIFDLFQQIILLHNGKIAFSGTSKDAVIFFQSIGYPYKEEQNPAEYLVKSLAIVPGQELKTSDKASNICEKFEKSQYPRNIDAQIERERYEKVESFNVCEKIERISWIYMLYLMTYRNLLGAIRDPSVQNIRIINKVALASILGFFMMGSITMTQEGLMPLKGMIFTMVTENSFPPMDNIIDHFPNRMFVFIREYSNDMSTPSIFYLSNIISLMPGFLFDSMLYTTLMYIFLGLKRSWYAFLGTIVVNILVINTAASFGTLVSLLTDSVFTSQSITLSVGIVYMSFSGIFMNVRSIAWILSWIRYVSWMTYAVESLLILQLDGVDQIQCSKATDVPCLRNGEEVLQSLGFNSNNLHGDVIMIFCIFVILQALSFSALKIRLYFKTNR